MANASDPNITQAKQDLDAAVQSLKVARDDLDARGQKLDVAYAAIGKSQIEATAKKDAIQLDLSKQNQFPVENNYRDAVLAVQSAEHRVKAARDRLLQLQSNSNATLPLLMEKIEVLFQAMNKRFDQVESRVTGLEQRFESRVTGLEQRFESRVTGLATETAKIKTMLVNAKLYVCVLCFSYLFVPDV